MISRLLGYFRRIGRWAWIDMMPFWRPFAVVAIVLLLCAPLPGEQHLRLSGLLLQLAGLATVAHGLNVTRAVFDLRSVPTAFREALMAFPRWSQSARVIVGSGAATLGGLRASAHGTSEIDPRASLDDKVQFLIAQMKNISQALNELQKKQETEVEQLTRALADEANERKGEDEKTRDLLRRTLTGGLVLETTGLLWLLVGIVLATAPKEILGLLPL